MERSIISGAQILSDQKWLKQHALVFEDGIITAIIPEDMIEHHLPATKHVFKDDHYCVPGFIDCHIHGANGKDVMDGNAESLEVMSRALAQEGVTSFLATTLSADRKTIERAIEVIVETAPKLQHAAIIGIHLEGPFIAADKVGAHDKQYLEKPQIALLTKWQELARGTIKIITVAAELPNISSFIHAAHKLHMLVSLGHSNASFEEAELAIEAGASLGTHLFNAMRGIHHRDPGVVLALLLAKSVSVELIVDGWHFHPVLAELVTRVKNKNHILLVTDAMRAKCLSDGQYELGSKAVNVKDGKATLDDGTLAGSTLTMPQAIRNMQHFGKCSLEEAVQMATQNPAEVLGIFARKGSIDVHKDADLVVLDGDFKVVKTLRQGKEIFSAPFK